MDKYQFLYTEDVEESCVKCSATRNLREYKGKTYCKNCLSQWLAMQ